MSAFVQFEKVRKVYQMGEVQIEALRSANKKATPVLSGVAFL